MRPVVPVRPRPVLAAALALACLAGTLHGQTNRPPPTRQDPPPAPAPQPAPEPAPQPADGGQGEAAPQRERGGGFRIPIRPSTVPDVRGMSLSAARIRLIAAGVRPGRVDSLPVADARPGTVVAQGPAPGTTVIPGYAVRLTLARAEVVTVPDLSGATLASARSRLDEARLAVGAVDSAESERAEGTVFRQEPAAGATVAPGTPVAVSVAAARLVAVPDLSGQPLARAASTLRDAGLRVGGVDTAAARGQPSLVLRQSVAAGQRVKPGTPVDVVVARGTVTVPDLSGRTLADAGGLLRQSRLSAGAVDSADSERARGTVVGQRPAAGAEVAPGTSVSLSLARPALAVVPDLRRRSEEEARAALRAAGLQPGNVATVADAAAASTVVGQSVEPGQRVPRGTAVALSVSSGPLAAGEQTPAGPTGETQTPQGPTDGGQPPPDGTPPAPAPPSAEGATPPGTTNPAGGGVSTDPTARGDVGTATQPAARTEERRVPWPWIVVALLVAAAVGAMVMGRKRPAAGSAPLSAPGGAAPPPPVLRTSGAWDPAAPKVVRVEKLIKLEVALSAAADAGRPEVRAGASLVAAEEER